MRYYVYYVSSRKFVGEEMMNGGMLQADGHSEISTLNQFYIRIILKSFNCPALHN